MKSIMKKIFAGLVIASVVAVGAGIAATQYMSRTYTCTMHFEGHDKILKNVVKNYSNKFDLDLAGYVFKSGQLEKSGLETPEYNDLRTSRTDGNFFMRAYNKETKSYDFGLHSDGHDIKISHCFISK